MKRVVSGIKPTGDATIGNYLGAMKRWPLNQQSQESFFFVANLHAITVKQDPKVLHSRTLDTVAWLLTVGVDPDISVIFVQSMIPAHSEICWILNNFTTMGELGKMTQYKDKSQKMGSDGQFVGLYDYPVLMAGDIILYDADEVPVGDDQKQHVELTRNIVNRFNNAFPDTFKMPKPTFAEGFSRIMSLSDPTQKMGKTEAADGNIFLNESKDSIIKKFKRAVTDSDNKIAFNPEEKPAISNLLSIYSGFSDKSIPVIEKEYENDGYGKFKTELGELVAEKITELQASFGSYRNNEEQLMTIIREGNLRASAIADAKVNEVKTKLGLL